MTNGKVYVGGAGILSSLGLGLTETEDTLRRNRSKIQPLSIFSLLDGDPLPVGQVEGLDQSSSLPRTHNLALLAARQAMTSCGVPPDAVIVGTTTGGIATTEQLLRNQEDDRELYRYHGLTTVAHSLAREFQCTGPVLTVSTACSSGMAAIAAAVTMLRSGRAERVLVGGVDSLSRLTYFGFHSLQLVDRKGCRPLDKDRQGMAVGEGAAMLLLTTTRPQKPMAELLGAGISCDAHHPAAPHPEGLGAYMAMAAALSDAGIQAEDIDYINLHGTGTQENDLSESRAVRRLFPIPPPLSSIKGASGHSLAASGAIEAVVSAIAVSKNLLPANTGLHTVDPVLKLNPLTEPMERPVKAVLSNSFGFGGNNGSLVIGSPGTFSRPSIVEREEVLAIHGYACLTGAGNISSTLSRLKTGGSAAGMAGFDTISENLPPQLIRRLKRLPRMALALAAMAQSDTGPDTSKAGSIFMGTGWGALSETHDFLNGLTASGEKFASPTDFVGSVHNGPAGQVAIMFGATGPNITASGGDYSFEQALLTAELRYGDKLRPALLMSADEGHEVFSPLLDSSVAPGSPLADGGGAFLLSRDMDKARCCISMPYYRSCRADGVIAALVDSLGGAAELQSRYALVLAGIPSAMKDEGERQLEQFKSHTRSSVPIFQYRGFTGEFASASAVATALAASLLETKDLPEVLGTGRSGGVDSARNSILVLGLGQYVSAVKLHTP